MSGNVVVEDFEQAVYKATASGANGPNWQILKWVYHGLASASGQGGEVPLPLLKYKFYNEKSRKL